MIGVSGIGQGQQTGGWKTLRERSRRCALVGGKNRIGADGDEFEREKQHQAFVFASTLDGVMDPSCRIISPTPIIRPSSPLACRTGLAFGESNCVLSFGCWNILIHMVEWLVIR